MCFFKIASCLVLSAVAAGASAKGVTYKCEMYNQGVGGWVGERMFLSIDPETGVGAVYDAALALAEKPPLPVTVTVRSPTLFKYRWEVEGVPSGNVGKARLSYSALLNTKTGRVTLSGRLFGYDNQISGAGRCAPIKQ